MANFPFSMGNMRTALPVSKGSLSRESVHFRDRVSERTISSAPSSRTFSDICSVNYDFDNEERETTSLTRERLAELNRRIKEEERKKTTSRTREELRKQEAYLAKLEQGDETTSRTRERLAMIDRKIADAERMKSSSRTREELAKKEEKLRKLREDSVIRAPTREHIMAVDRAIEEERRRSKHIRASAESAIVTKERELSTLREVNARKECIKQAMRNIAIAQVTDLAFLLDCTGSMDAYITSVKDEIQQIVKNVKEDHPDVKLNVAFVGYRDHSDHIRIEKLPFTNEYNSFSSFLNGITASGGGDTAEDVFGGLEETCKLAWKSPCRVLMHFGDAPCHGNRFHEGVMDDDNMMNDSDRRGLRIENLLSLLKQLNIRYYFGQINSSTDKMVRVFREVAKDSNFPFMVNISDTSKVCSAISESVSSSIAATVEQVTKIPFRRPAFSPRNGMFSIEESETVMSKPSRSLKPYRITNDEPNWDRSMEYKVESINAKAPTSFDNLKDSLETNSIPRFLKIAPQPFAEGGQRISLRGLDCSPSLKVHKEKVLKEFKHTGDSYKDYVSILETHCIADFLAKEFFKVNSSQKICYLRVSIVKFKDKHHKEKLYTSESLLENYEVGFQKWTNNTSFVNKASYSDTIHAFSHWTYEKTNGYLMICDLQGVEKNDQYILTDPAMHCTDLLRFGTTNLGNEGMKKFFRTHKCNDICKSLRLKERR